MGGTVGQIGETYDDRAARGGPALRQDRYLAPWLAIGGDDRKAIVPFFNVNYFTTSEGRSHSLSMGPELNFKAAGEFSSSLSLNWSHNINDAQWYNNYDLEDGTHYTFAHLDQTTTSLTARLNYTFTPNVSLQTYLQPFVSKGTYSDVRQLSATPRAEEYDARFAPYLDSEVTSDPGGFNFKQLQSNVVFRWEYSPGSTLFLVWNEGRQGSLDAAGDTPFHGDVRDMFGLHPANTFLVKVSYWLNR
jgi:hypothetical protein